MIEASSHPKPWEIPCGSWYCPQDSTDVVIGYGVHRLTHIIGPIDCPRISHSPPPPPPPPSTSHSQILRVAEITRLYSEEDGKQHIASMKSKLDDYVTCIILFACTSTSSETSVVFFLPKAKTCTIKIKHVHKKSLSCSNIDAIEINHFI